MADPKPKEQKDQQHPLYRGDRTLVNDLMRVEAPTERNLADLARLCIRYRGFPGARDIQTDLLKVLQKWQFSEPELFAQTRKIHAESKVYGSTKDGRDDWA
ncbi:Protein of unknown function (DUF3288) [Synechococcus sp. PCC 7502]|uniref:DUF3288 family protein n=1 Tax=Synechococcus sp. PCC 7502 TaxID=1173263 RepID=UPI00029FA0F3|nr:DUF3288 family protein [Synechococcus sp. PCC 7502]AFY72224.1 Protein of unknown function (DUF3288) [Synechococcus sp. PCC 7502]